MINYIMDYLEENGTGADTADENVKLIAGIRLYLTENGISEEKTREYFKQYIDKHLAVINDNDLKQYFMMYPVISEVNQIAIEYKSDGILSKDRIGALYNYMAQLYAHGIGDKYVPAVEVKEILGGLV